MRISTSQLNPQLALRALWGIAALGMLFERAPWAQSDLLAAGDGYLGFLALGLWAVTGGSSGWSRKALAVVVVAWLAVMAYRISGGGA